MAGTVGSVSSRYRPDIDTSDRYLNDVGPTALLSGALNSFDACPCLFYSCDRCSCVAGGVAMPSRRFRIPGVSYRVHIITLFILQLQLYYSYFFISKPHDFGWILIILLVIINIVIIGYYEYYWFKRHFNACMPTSVGAIVSVIYNFVNFGGQLDKHCFFCQPLKCCLNIYVSYMYK